MNYDYVKVDPRAIKMLGGDSQDLLNEGFDGDLPSDAVDNFGENLQENVLTDDVFSATIDGDTVSVVDKDASVLKQILNELREIKAIIAGK